MKTLREYIDQLDEISRRDFLKGAGAAAVGAAVGQPQGAKADWDAIHDDDLLTGERKFTGFRNNSNEDPRVQLIFNPWKSVGGFIASITGVPLPFEPGPADGRIGEALVRYSPYRILIGSKLFNDLRGGLYNSDNGTGMILATQNGLNREIIPAIANSIKTKDTIKIEISASRKVYTFAGNNRFFEEQDLEEASPDAVKRIEELVKYK